MKHHSPADFDFRSSNWSLTTDQYVSAPSSLRLNRLTDNTIQVVLLKAAISGVVEQGRLEGFWRPDYFGDTRLNAYIFRNKSADGGAATFPFYAVCFSQVKAYWRKYTAPNTYTTLATWSSDTLNFVYFGLWRKVRVSWWNGYNAQNQPATVVRLERLIDSTWYACADAYDTEQVNKGESVQRCGVGYHGTEAGVWTRTDDTEFYKAVE